MQQASRAKLLVSHFISLILFNSIIFCVCHLVFGADETLPTWEEQRLKQAAQYVSEITAILETRKDLIISSLPEHIRQQVTGTIIKVLYEPKTAFSVKTNPSTRTMFFTTETYVTLSKIAMAVEIGIMTGDEHWENNYLHYLRRNRHRTPIVDPLRAAGFLTARGKRVDGVSPDLMEELINGHHAILENMVMFLIAHELGHIAIPAIPSQSNETDAARVLRHRQDEMRADEFAIDALISTMKKDNDRPIYISGGPQLFLAWLHMSETANDNIFRATHPPHHDRARAVARYIQAKANTLDLIPKEIEQLNRAILDTESELDEVDRDAVAYFRKLDDAAANITLVDLRRAACVTCK